MADIFDKIVSGINKGVTTVGANSKAMIEKAKVNTAIKSLEEEKGQLAELLGLKVYTSFAQGAETPKEEIESFCNEITKRVQLIAEQQQELLRIDAEAKAATGGSGKPRSAQCSCGHMNTEGSKFCTKCGNIL